MSVYRDPDVPIEVIVGQTFTIALEALPSGGYTWMEVYDPDMIELLKPKYYAPRAPEIGEDADRPRIGEGREEMFEFQTRQPGETHIELKNQREWEATARDIKIFRVHITRQGR